MRHLLQRQHLERARSSNKPEGLTNPDIMSYTSTILITGGTTGLGYEAALAIAQTQPETRVIISSRSSGDDAVSSINQRTGRSNVKYMRLDLASLQNVRQFSKAFLDAKYPPISALVLNAGIQVVSGITYTQDGIETTFGVNHVGHALLLHLLASQLKPDARVVITGSGTHDPAQKSGLPDAKYEAAEQLARPDEESIKKNKGRQRYATSKLCNVLWLYALDKKRSEQGKRWTVTAMDPGLMPGTGLARDASAIEKFLWHRILPYLIPFLRLVLSPNIHTPKESGEALARLAIGGDVAGISGKYFEGTNEIQSSKDSHDVEKQSDLWQWTLGFVSQDEQEKRKFMRLG